MQQFNTYKGVKGSRFAYNHQVRTAIEEKRKSVVEHRLKIVDHARKFGVKSAISAFNVSERTIKYYRSKLRKKNGNPNALIPESTRPLHLNSPHYSKQVSDYVKKTKLEFPKLGKEKIAVFLKKDLGQIVSPSTVARIIIHLKERGELPTKKKVSFYAKTGILRFRKQTVPKVKLRRKGYIPKGPGDLIQTDTIVIYVLNKKYFLPTAIDIWNRKAHAHVSKSHSSNTAKELLLELPQVFGCKILHTQTDNGSEFKKHFDEACTSLGITHFWNHVRSPKENAYVERFNRSIQEEWVKPNTGLFYLGNLEKLNSSLRAYLIWYNTRRPHWGLDLLTPDEYTKKSKQN